ncbi:MAG: 4Fe-4S dicluster domain-containing protein, partial [Actinomycetales bacterium]
MPHVVTQSCCADASCVHACPVNCIHPTPDEPDFGKTDMVYVDPLSCVDCGACVTACPVGAISAHTRLGEAELPFIDLNAAFHSAPAGPRALQAPVPRLPRLREARRVSVAIVGAGPAAIYTAAELVKNEQVHVTILERLDVPHGLARFGISPDHRRTRQVAGQLDRILDHPRVTLRTGVEVGRDVSLDALRSEHDAVSIRAASRPTLPAPTTTARSPSSTGATASGCPFHHVTSSNAVVTPGSSAPGTASRRGLQAPEASTTASCSLRRASSETSRPTSTPVRSVTRGWSRIRSSC